MRAVVEDLRRSGEREVPSMRIGELVMRELKKLDQVAYVRFASVYRRFQDVQAFREEIERLERDLPAIEGLQLPLLDEADAAQERGSRASRIERALRADVPACADDAPMTDLLRAPIMRTWRARCALAERGLYTTQPNPRVGCVIAHGDDGRRRRLASARRRAARRGARAARSRRRARAARPPT